MVSLKMSILQIWVTWASKITLKICSSVASKLREATHHMQLEKCAHAQAVVVQ